MSRITSAGRRLQIEALAKALVGGVYRTFDGDGRVLHEAPISSEPEITSDTSFVFKGLTGKVTATGYAVGFAAFGPGSPSPLISGTIGRSLNKFTHAEMEDQLLHPGMDLDIETFEYSQAFGA